MQDDHGFSSGGRPEERAQQSDDWDDEKYATRPAVREIYDPLDVHGARASSPAGQSLDSHSDETRAPNAASAKDHSMGQHAGGTPAAHKPPQKKRVDEPLWQQLTGLTPQQEPKMTRKQRREAIGTLLRQYEIRIRESLDEYEKEQREAANPSPQPPPAAGGGAGSGGPDTPVGAARTVASERTFLWSPLDAICFELSIARRKLSAYMRELTGMSAQEVIDKIKAETLAAKLKERLALQAKHVYEVLFAEEEKSYRHRSKQNKYPEWETKLERCSWIKPGDVERAVAEARAKAEAGMNCEPRCGWALAAGDMLKRVWETRRAQPCIAWAENSRYTARQQFARELGFSSYNRLYRACLLAFGKTLMELEHAAGLALLTAFDQEAAPRREAVKAEVLAAGT